MKTYLNILVVFNFIFLSGCAKKTVYSPSSNPNVNIEDIIEAGDRIKLRLVDNSLVTIHKVSLIQDGMLIGISDKGEIKRIKESDILQLETYVYPRKSPKILIAVLISITLTIVFLTPFPGLVF